MASQLFARKPLSVLLEEARSDNRLRRVLGPVQLTSLGVGAVIGAGIFVTTGAIARQTAGPALMLSYVIAGLVCILAALCYAEFASMVPVAGSACTYAYATLGELFAWIIGWDLVLEYAVGAATGAAQRRRHPGERVDQLPGLNVFGRTLLGQSDAGGNPLGMLAGAALAFFACIGFDSVSTHAEEARRPQRDVPIGIVVSLILCTLLYIGVVAVLTGMVPYDQLDVAAPVADAFQRVGLGWAHLLIALAGVAGITSVLLVMMLSQPRVLLAMARDGLLPESFFGAIHERFRTPWKSTLLTGLFVGALAAFLPINVLLMLVNMGTLLAFVIVCAAVLVMRRRHPEAERPFRVPFVPVVPVLGILSCLLLMFSLPAENWERLFLWLGLGLLIYFGYGRRHSVVARLASNEAPALPAARTVADEGETA